MGHSARSEHTSNTFLLNLLSMLPREESIKIEYSFEIGIITQVLRIY